MRYFTFIGLLLSVLTSCRTPEYKFNYTVAIKYSDGTLDTIQGSQVVATKEPEKQVFTLSSRLRMRACLTFGFLGTNMACDVKSFNVKELTYTKL